jgi:UDP:flavonoid glycosyltransferase YjiC (YdhE family)
VCAWPCGNGARTSYSREPAEFASAIVAEEEGVPHVQIGIALAASHMQLMSLASEAVETWGSGLTERILATPYLTLFPASLEDPEVAGPPHTRRFRDPAADAPSRPLTDWWAGDARPLVYVTFGSETAGVPTAAPIYDVALASVAGLPARVLLTTGEAMDEERLAAPGAHVHIERWVTQADVLPHARVVVCHGGSGTTLGALAAGVPLVITPLFADQPENGRRVAAVGAGVVVKPRDDGALRSAVDPAHLHDAIAAVIADDAFAREATAIASEIRELPPADEAITLLAALR